MRIRDRLSGLGNRARRVSGDVRLKAMLAQDKLVEGADGLRNRAQSAWKSDKAQNLRDSAKERARNLPGNVKNVVGGVGKAGDAAVNAGKGLMGGLGNIKDLVEPNSATIFLFLSAALFLLDRTIGYTGFNITRVESFLEILKFVASLGYMIGIWVFFFIFVSKERNFRSLVSSIIAFVVVIFGLTLAFNFDPLSVLHILFILIFWLGFLRKSEDAATANWMLIALLVADMFLFSILNWFSPDVALILQGFPFLFFLTVFFVYEKTSNLIALGFIFFIFGWYFLTAAPALAEHFGLAGIEGIRTYLPNPKELGGLFKENVIDKGFGKIKTGVAAWLSGQIQYAISGKVEENQYEPLGVYLDNVESTAERYYIDKSAFGDGKFEDVIVFGTVRGRTLDDPINVKVGCFVEKNDIEFHADFIDPKNKFTIFSLEEQDFACTFTKDQIKNGILKKGTNTITTFADFNFETLAFQKVYFIDRERQRAMTREGLNVFEEFDIRDRNPVSVYTNGPAAIEMGTSSPIVGVSNNYLAFPRFSLAIKNRQGWDGRITGLKELILLMPKGVNIENPGVEVERDEDGNIIKDEEGMDIETLMENNDCNVRFKRYILADCQSSCEKFVLKECNTVCGSYGDGPSSEKDSCQVYCRDGQQDCENQCQFLFNEDNQEYDGYALADSAIETLNKRVYSGEDAERFERFNCKINPKRDEVLGNAPITTKFFRVKVRYDYIVEEPITIQIIELEGTDDSKEKPKDSEDGSETSESSDSEAQTSSESATPISSSTGVPTPTPTSVLHRTPSGMTVTPSEEQGIIAEITGGPLKNDVFQLDAVGFRNEIIEHFFDVEGEKSFEFRVSVSDSPIIDEVKANPIWFESEERSVIDVYIGDAQKKLEDDPDHYESLAKLIAGEWAMEELYPET